MEYEKPEFQVDIIAARDIITLDSYGNPTGWEIFWDDWETDWAEREDWY